MAGRKSVAPSRASNSLLVGFCFTFRPFKIVAFISRLNPDPRMGLVLHMQSFASCLGSPLGPKNGLAFSTSAEKQVRPPSSLFDLNLFVAVSHDGGLHFCHSRLRDLKLRYAHQTPDTNTQRFPAGTAPFRVSSQKDIYRKFSPLYRVPLWHRGETVSIRRAICRISVWGRLTKQHLLDAFP